MSTSLPKTLPRFIWHFIKPQWGRFLWLIYGNIGWAVQEAVFPYFIKRVIDKVTLLSNEKTLIFTELSSTLMLWAGLWLLIELGFRLYDFLSARVFPKFQADIRKAMFDYILLHSHQFFADQFAGSMGSKVSRMADALLRIITTVFTIFVPVVMAFMINIVILYQTKPLFAYIMAGWFTLHMSLTILFTRNCAMKSATHSLAVTTLNGKIIDAFSNIANIRLFARKPYEMRYFNLYQKEEIKRYHELLHYNAIMKLFLGLASLVFIFTMIGLGIYSWQQGLITNGELALILTSLSLIGLAWYMGMHLIEIYENVGTAKESLSLIEKSHDITDTPKAKPIDIQHGEIVFDNVSFHYSKSHLLFDRKNITLKAGQKVGLVGYSGSGKTSFVNLILRLFDIDNGRILIDGQDIKNITQDSLRDQIALIPQDTALFHRSLLENIRYGLLDASDEAVIAAAKKAHCHDFIEALPEGYQTLVGERGVKLSGGQRQRIAIARAILKDAPILILDEATASLDSVTEKLIQESLHELMKNRTAIVIAHRLSTLSEMDRILVFKDGQIVEDGSHEMLLQKNQHYAMLWHMQANGFLPDQPTLM